MPCDIVRLPCGSMSTQSTRWPSSTKAAARFSVVVVFATPPFWLAKAMTLAWPVTARLLGSGGRTIGPRFAPVGRSPAGWAQWWGETGFACQARGSFLALAFGDVTGHGLGPRGDGLVPREPRC